jgi:hypothetical protein
MSTLSRVLERRKEKMVEGEEWGERRGGDGEGKEGEDGEEEKERAEVLEEEGNE